MLYHGSLKPLLGVLHQQFFDWSLFKGEEHLQRRKGKEHLQRRKVKILLYTSLNASKSNLPNINIKKVISNIRILIVKFRLSNAQFPDIDTAFTIKKNIKQFKFDQFFDKWNKKVGVY